MEKDMLKVKMPVVESSTVVDVDGRTALLHLIATNGASIDTVTTAQLTAWAERLSVVAGMERAWTRSYLHQVLHGILPPSTRFTHTVAALLNEVDGVSPLLTRSHPVTVNALGNVQPGTVLFGDSRNCANPACYLPFMPRSWNQRYCSATCRERKNKHAS